MSAFFPAPRLRPALLAGLLCAALAGGCGSVPPTSFYTLHPPPPGKEQIPKHQSGLPVLSLMQVRLPSVLERPQIVLRDGEQRVHVLEHARWAGSLQEMVQQHLQVNLQNEMPKWRVASRSELAGYQGSGPVWQLWVEILRLDAQPAQDARLEANWQWRNGDKIQRHSISLKEACQGNSLEAALAAQQNLLLQMGREIARQGQAMNEK